MLEILRSNRLEVLTAELANRLKAPVSTNPLLTDPIVVAHPGMERWLRLQLAGDMGVVLGTRFFLPAQYTSKLLHAARGEDERPSPLDHRNHLIWMLYGALKLPPEPLLPYLQPDSDGATMRRHHLAVQLAAIYEQYSYERPDWLHAWSEGRESDRDREQEMLWQSDLWRQLQGALEQQGEHGKWQLPRASALLAFDAEVAALPQRLHIFSLPMLPPHFRLLLSSLIEKTQVCMYDLVPGQHYYGDTRRSANSQSDSPVVGERLMGLLGDVVRDSQKVFLEMEEKWAEQELEAVNVQERYVVAGSSDGDSLLEQLQSAVSALEEKPFQLAKDDHSLQLHSCHSALREVQVLRDVLLRLMEQDESLQPSDILVLAPDIKDYEASVRAVFGTAEDNLKLPWSLADRSLGESGELVRALLALLHPDAAKPSLPQIFGLLEKEAVQRRFALDELAVSSLRRWCRDAGARIGSDGLDTGAEALWSWDHAIARLIAGFALAPADTDGESELPVAVGSLHSGGAEWLATLYLLVRHLYELRARIATEPSLEQWREICTGLCDLASPSDRDEKETLSDFAASFHRMLGEAKMAGMTSLPADVVHANLLLRLEDMGLERGFLTGGITFCSLVPMRSVPARVICLMGMDATAFPRTVRPSSLDLRVAHPRLGDRTLRSDDLHLFLQALLSAGDHFIISWQGHTQRDNKPLPPATPVGELQALLPSEICSQVLHEHPLQPFSRRYGHELPTYGREWLPLRGDKPLPPPRPLQVELENAPERLALSELQRFLHNPAHFFLVQRLHLKLPKLEEEMVDTVPYSLSALDAWKCGDYLVRRMLEGNCPSEEDLRQRGLLPAGNSYRKRLEEVIEETKDLVLRLESNSFIPNAPEADYEVQLDGCVLTARLPLNRQERLIRWRVGKMRPRDLLNFWTEHLFWSALVEPCASSDEEAQPSNLWLTSKKNKELPQSLQPVPPQKARAILTEMMQLYQRGQNEILPFFPQASYAFVGGKKPSLAKARQAWGSTDSPRSGEWGSSEAWRLLYGPLRSPLLPKSFYLDPWGGPEQALDGDFEQLAQQVFSAIGEYSK